MKFSNVRMHTKKIDKATRDAVRLEKKQERLEKSEGNWKKV